MRSYESIHTRATPLWHDRVRGIMTTPTPDLVVLYEHPEWQKPLFAALERRGVAYGRFNIVSAAFSNLDTPAAPLYFNQASPSAYVRGHARAVPLALAYMRSLERQGARVLNGADVFALELSKSTQATLLRTLGIDTPYSITFNDVSALRRQAPADLRWPALLKPDQGGSGARIQVVSSWEEIEAVFTNDPDVWLPDNLFLLQEFLPHDPDQGIVRMEFLGGELLYAMRVKTHGRFNLCPSPVCNPESGEGSCAAPGGARGCGTGRRVLSIPGRAARGRGDRKAHRARGTARRRRDRVSGNRRRAPRVLRHQRQLEPETIGRRGLGLRSIRSRRRLPGATARRRVIFARTLCGGRRRWSMSYTRVQ